MKLSNLVTSVFLALGVAAVAHAQWIKVPVPGTPRTKDGKPNLSAPAPRVERYRRPDFGHLVIEFTFTDPKYYARPWTATVPFNLLPDTELIEHFCENEKDLGQIDRK